MRGYPHFSFGIPITLAKIYFFPTDSRNLCKNTSVLGGTVLKLENWKLYSVILDHKGVYFYKYVYLCLFVSKRLETSSHFIVKWS